MDQEILIMGGFILLIVWAIGLSVVFWNVWSHYRKLVGDAKEKDLRVILEGILDSQKETRRIESSLKTEIDKLSRDGQLHIQKIGLVRYNPFNETGGDHSFSLAVLDGKLDGVILTCLHTRERARIYVKSIRGGKSEKEISQEEKKAIELATK